MRKIVLSLLALCCFSAVMAQQKTRSLSVELLGAQNIAGINYDSRFKGGASLGVYQVKETIGYVEDTWWYPGGENTDETSPKTYFYTSSRTQFGYFFFGDIGYRYQRPNGFMFRVGVSPSFNFGDKYGLNKAAFFPYIGFGWSF